MGHDQPFGQVDELRVLLAGREGLEIRRACEEPLLQGEVVEECLVERLGLLHKGLGHRADAAENGSDDIDESAAVAKSGLDRLGTLPRLLGVLGEFLADRVGPGLGLARLGDLDLGVGHREDCTKLLVDGGGGNCHRSRSLLIRCGMRTPRVLPPGPRL